MEIISQKYIRLLEDTRAKMQLHFKSEEELIKAQAQLIIEDAKYVILHHISRVLMMRKFKKKKKTRQGSVKRT